MPVDDEHLLAVEGALLHRQVHPMQRANGRASNGLFLPKEREAGQVSVDRDERASAAEAWRRYTSAGGKSAEVWSVTVEEVAGQKLRAYADELDENDAHALVDFAPLMPSAMTFKEQVKLCNPAALALSRCASARGVSFVAPASDPGMPHA